MIFNYALISFVLSVFVEAASVTPYAQCSLIRGKNPCQSGYSCCFAPSDVNIKRTCRAAGECEKDGKIWPRPTFIGDFEACTILGGGECNVGFICDKGFCVHE